MCRCACIYVRISVCVCVLSARKNMHTYTYIMCKVYVYWRYMYMKVYVYWRYMYIDIHTHMYRHIYTHLHIYPVSRYMLIYRTYILCINELYTGILYKYIMHTHTSWPPPREGYQKWQRGCFCTIFWLKNVFVLFFY